MRMEEDIRKGRSKIKEEGKMKLRKIRIGINIEERSKKIEEKIEIFKREEKEERIVIEYKWRMKGFERLKMKFGIEGSEKRKEELVKRIEKVFMNDMEEKLLGEILGRKEIMGRSEGGEEKGMIIWVLRLGSSDIEIIGNEVDKKVEEIDGEIGMEEGMVIVRKIGKGRKIGNLRNGKLEKRIVEIGKWRNGNEIGKEKKENIVKVKIKNEIIGIWMINENRKDGLIDIEIIGMIGDKKEVIRKMLSDGGGEERKEERKYIIKISEKRKRKEKEIEEMMIIKGIVLGGKERRIKEIRKGMNRKIKE